VLNDANAHALAVAFDRARDHAHEPASPSWRVALLLRIGGDVGASTLLQAPHSPGRSSFIDSVLVGGARTLGGEIGHLPVESAVVDLLNARSRWVDGLAPLSMDWPCPCGGSGHLASLASGTAWERRMRESDVSLPALLDGVRRGERSLTDRALAETVDPRGIYALEDIGRLIARALAAPVLLLDPHSLTLSGSFAVQAVRDGMIAERETWRHVFGDALSIDFAGSPDRVKYMGVRGAALAVLRRHVYRRFLELLTEPTPTRGLEFTL
jgi:predicted NBD/HSP70 family sugar kinase